MGLVLFCAVVGFGAIVLLDLRNLGHPVLDPVADMASYFVHADGGWLIVLAGVGCAFAAFATVPAVRAQRAVAVAVSLFGVGFLVAGLVPTQPYGDWDAPPSTATLVHGAAGWLAFLALPTAAWLLRGGPPAARWLAGVASASLVLLAVGTVEVMDGPDHLGHVLGLLERLMIAADLGWLVVVARARQRA